MLTKAFTNVNIFLNKNSQISTRVDRLMVALGINSKEEISERLGCSRTHLWKILKGTKEPDGKFVASLELLESELNIKREYRYQPSTDVNMSPVVEEGNSHYGVRSIPVLSYAHAGTAMDYEEIPPDWREFVPTDCIDEKAFGLRIEGDSMEIRYSEGDVIVVMPGTPPRNGCLVAANIKSNGIIFRRMSVGTNSSSMILSPYNPIYPTQEYKMEEMEWVYPIHSVIKKEW